MSERAAEQAVGAAVDLADIGNEFVKVARHGNIAVMTITNPGKKNAFGLKMREGMISAFRHLMYFDKETRAVVLTGADGAFCSGGDISEMKDMGLLRWRERLILTAGVPRAMLTGPKAVVAAVEGVAFGAGWSLAMASDYVVASGNARFCAAFARVGLIPDTALMWTLTQRIGRTRARQYMMLATEITAADALSQRIIDEVAEPGQALTRALAVAAQYAAMPPVSQALIKEAMAAGTDTFADALKAEVDYQSIAVATADHREAIKAFVEKRKPVFTGE
jgi:enoyl-CoA hydratase/carnithine racemase